MKGIFNFADEFQVVLHSFLVVVDCLNLRAGSQLGVVMRDTQAF